jgi:hypothetical protein
MKSAFTTRAATTNNTALGGSKEKAGPDPDARPGSTGKQPNGDGCDLPANMQRATRKDRSGNPEAPWASLPFVGEGTERPLNFWKVTPEDDGEADARRGAEYGAMALAAKRRTGFAPLVGWIIADMIAGGRCGQLELGFINHITGEKPR